MNVPIDITGTVLRTPRLTLRPWSEADLADLYEYACVPGVGEMAGWKHHESVEESRRILDMFISEKKTFAIEYESRVIGSLGSEEYDEEQYPGLAPLRCREIGYVLSKDHWGRGLMPEAVTAAADYLFEKIGADAVVCGHFTQNGQSARVQEKCGFRYYAGGTFRTAMGTVENNVLNILTRDEWAARRR
jgi:ribosomal-protein-alanine N-acetyltransferase